LFHKEKVLMYVGMVSAAIMVAAIFLGSLYSVIDIARFYTLSYLTMIIPINLVFGFGKTFGFKPAHVINFWAPKIILSLMILFAVWTDRYFISVISILIYLAHILYFQRNDIVKIFEVIRGKINFVIRNKFSFKKSKSRYN
ncbi:MAG: hypothetical protein ACOCWM_00150, partial [Cyclobacteriaceae bacterium]